MQSKQIILQRHLPAYWRVTFDHPPLNIFGPETIPQLNEIITELETDEQSRWWFSTVPSKAFS
jgi:enoyl-CoA hydratase/carnithine racemase